jgi:hypothetical protein
MHDHSSKVSCCQLATELLDVNCSTYARKLADICLHLLQYHPQAYILELIVVFFCVGLQGEAVGFRSSQRRAGRRRDARVDPGDGDPRIRRAGVHHDGPLDGEERRVRLRRGAAGAAVGAEGGGQEPPPAGAEPGGVGAAVPDGRAPPGPRHGPQPGGPVLQPGRAQGRRRGAPVRRPQPQVPPTHVRRRRSARAAPRARRLPRRALRLHRTAGDDDRQRGRSGAGE